MKTKAIAIMLGIFLCGTAHGEWVQFISYNGSPVYFDPDRIMLKLDGKVAVWQKAVLNIKHMIVFNSCNDCRINSEAR